MSNGVERVPIRCVGKADGPRPQPFSYVRSSISFDKFVTNDDADFLASPSASVPFAPS